jgi:hypothetical protein
VGGGHGVGLFGSEQGSVEGCCGDGNEPSISIKGRYMGLVALLNGISACYRVR